MLQKDKSQQTKPWSLTRAREFYSINYWSEGYFDINSVGHIAAKPSEAAEIDLIEISKKLKQQGLSLPVLLRFPQILQSRLKQIDSAFTQAAESHKCDIKHVPCYPIKVNQQRTVIEHLLATDIYSIGLEVGSKTELILALGMLAGKQAYLICNGYKDRAYIRIAMYAQSMGIDVIVVIENPSELRLIRQECERLNLKPKLGLRLKLNSVAQGVWQNSGGKDAKFGLTASEILYCLTQLEQSQNQDWLCLLHFHMGSQITKLDEFAKGLQEALVVYRHVIEKGFNIEYLDVGGGLAIDYASQHDTSYFSRAYTIKEYAHTIISSIWRYCRENELNLPTVLTENGRAITAHHAMLLTNIINTDDAENIDINFSQAIHDKDELYQIAKSMQNLNTLEQIDRNELLRLFEEEFEARLVKGELSLEQRAWSEQVMKNFQINKHLSDYVGKHHYVGQGIFEKYYGNFSLFQSIPDVWGLQQIFPVVPLHRLNECPTQKVQLYDLTCDSDGSVKSYAYDDSIHQYLLMHEFTPEQEYLVGFFLVGAYQEVLGDMHNLFGDTHAVNVVLNDNGIMEFIEVETGDCVNELLDSVHISGEQVINQCMACLSQTNTTNVTSEEMLEEINNALYGYTYLDSIDRPPHKIKN